MNPLKSAGDVHAYARDAGEFYFGAISLGEEDLRLRALKYPLLRLSTDGLTERDRADLIDLAKIAVDEGDLTSVAEAIRDRTSASPIAVAIAGVVLSARGSKWNAMLGAVIGAHAAQGASRFTKDVGLDVFGAVIGAACLQNNKFLQQFIDSDLKAFIERDI